MRGNDSRVVELEKKTGSWKQFPDSGLGCDHAYKAAMVVVMTIGSLCIDERFLRSLSMTTKHGMIPNDIEMVAFKMSNIARSKSKGETADKNDSAIG